MARELKVYRWIETAQGAAENEIANRNHDGNHRRQMTAVCAAYSKAEVGRAAGEPPRRLWNLGATGNTLDCEVAMAKPGVVFIAPLDRIRSTEDYFEREA
ncbi:MAG: hypothetical protein WBG86_14515 [Polyangiales bacterium]